MSCEFGAFEIKIQTSAVSTIDPRTKITKETHKREPQKGPTQEPNCFVTKPGKKTTTKKLQNKRPIDQTHRRESYKRDPPNLFLKKYAKITATKKLQNKRPIEQTHRREANKREQPNFFEPK